MWWHSHTVIPGVRDRKESSCTEVAPLLTLTPLSHLCTLSPSRGQSSPASTRQPCGIARAWISGRGALEVSSPSPAHLMANPKVGQACPGSEISQPLRARDAMQLLRHGEILFPGIPFPDKFHLLVPSLLFCRIPASEPLVNGQRPKPTSTLNFSAEGTYTPTFP